MSVFEGKTVLVTGGGGYIGSHCILQLLEHKFKVLAIDNFDNAVQGKLKFYRYVVEKNCHQNLFQDLL